VETLACSLRSLRLILHTGERREPLRQKWRKRCEISSLAPVATGIHVLRRVADSGGMSVSPITSASPSEFEPPSGLEIERTMEVLQKQQEVAQIQGKALGQPIEQSTRAQIQIGAQFSAYA
jgi:hypothetical protein